ncbi:MAG: hypothetical protein LBU64_08155 [Planctomycetota bacterium]|jgi:hypothetical protein|nr:hypothetical protein [Planctomycetota bacterium]
MPEGTRRGKTHLAGGRDPFGGRRRGWFVRAGGLAAGLSLGLIFSGCSLGFLRLGPEESASLYGEILRDFLPSGDSRNWAYARGSISGDFNGDGKADEEALVVTIQDGTRKRPGNIQTAHLLILSNARDSPRRIIARTELFAGNPIPGAPRPESELDQATEIPLMNVGAQIIPDPISPKVDLVIYFWGETRPGGVWYAGYSLENGGALRKILETSLWQQTPGFLAVNLDKNPESGWKKRQLLFAVPSLPGPLADRLGKSGEIPLWGHVFARDDGGNYRQADRVYAGHYHNIADKWNQAYLKALLDGLPPGDLAWFEYRLGLLNLYTGNPDLAGKFFDRAEKGNADEKLAKAIRLARSALK